MRKAITMLQVFNLIQIPFVIYGKNSFIIYQTPRVLLCVCRVILLYAPYVYKIHRVRKNANCDKLIKKDDFIFHSKLQD